MKKTKKKWKKMVELLFRNMHEFSFCEFNIMHIHIQYTPNKILFLLLRELKKKRKIALMLVLDAEIYHSCIC